MKIFLNKTIDMDDFDVVAVVAVTILFQNERTIRREGIIENVVVVVDLHHYKMPIMMGNR